MHGFSPLDNTEILAPLLDYADDLEVRDGLGWTPLMTAVNRGSKQNVNLLLARGAQIDCDWSKGMSLIADAMNFNDVGKLRYLLRSFQKTILSALRSNYDSVESWSSSNANRGYARQRARSECLLPAALRCRRWFARYCQAAH